MENASPPGEKAYNNEEKIISETVPKSTSTKKKRRSKTGSKDKIIPPETSSTTTTNTESSNQETNQESVSEQNTNPASDPNVEPEKDSVALETSPQADSKENDQLQLDSSEPTHPENSSTLPLDSNKSAETETKDLSELQEKLDSLNLEAKKQSSSEKSPDSEETPLKLPSRTSTSKFHNAIQELINQFDPLKEANAKKRSIDSINVKSEFMVDNDGFSYNKFLTQLRNPIARPIAKQTKLFLIDFEKRRLPLNLQIKAIQDFYIFISEKMFANEVWASLSEKEKENASEGIEKLVTTRLYHLIFSPSSTDDQAQDKVLREKMNLFRWLKETHLDIPESARNSQFIQFAKAGTLWFISININEFKSPRDKLICILNCCTVIFGLLKHVEGDVGADSFLPLLIYLIVITNPPKLISNVNYISRFRSPERLMSEAGYYLTNVMGAISFIQTMDASCLSISQEDFDRNIELSIWEIESEKRAKMKARANQPYNSNNASPSRGYWTSLIDEDTTEKAAKLLEKGTSFAKSTFEKTNQFVEKIFSEISDATDRTQDHFDSRPQDGNLQRIQENQIQTDNVVEGSEEWKQGLSIIYDMFPNFDKEVCEMILQANEGNVPRSIEQLLDMSLPDNLDFEEPVTVQEEQDTNLSGLDSVGLSNNESIILNPESSKSVGLADSTDLLKASEFDDSSKVAENVSDNEDDWKGQWADDSSDDEDYEPDQFHEVSSGNAEDTPMFISKDNSIVNFEDVVMKSNSKDSSSATTSNDLPVAKKDAESSEQKTPKNEKSTIPTNTNGKEKIPDPSLDKNEL
ncbi:hypothetical protein BB560_002971 [Smittium megazygosporum]|uniref:VPS9 domain-containing protein n=1 Tax=Smittium megazygosporum TaxID=133381 RepID=A0A2T9ZDE0_9FUNG|nr:hypothetical protein BB560_002971 [Smittium megazygosporum]